VAYLARPWELGFLSRRKSIELPALETPDPAIFYFIVCGSDECVNLPKRAADQPPRPEHHRRRIARRTAACVEEIALLF
jgi:hypothetical protein